MFSYDRLQLNGRATSSREASCFLANHLIELEILRGHTRRRRRGISVPAFLIGRAGDCDLVLGDDRFPDAFAYILVRGQQLLIRHLGFAPELTVNGQRVTQAPLQNDDTIHAGPYTFRLHIRPLETAGPSVGGSQGTTGIRPQTARAMAHTEALAEALDLIRCIREDVLGERMTFRLFIGPEANLANLPPLATLPVDSAAFCGRAKCQARSA
jgi:hypothetical protein